MVLVNIKPKIIMTLYQEPSFLSEIMIKFIKYDWAEYIRAYLGTCSK